jgi:hypothetical protein
MGNGSSQEIFKFMKQSSLEMQSLQILNPFSKLVDARHTSLAQLSKMHGLSGLMWLEAGADRSLRRPCEACDA